MATFDAHKNFAYSTVATAPSPATSGTSLVVASGDGAKFPTPPFNAMVWAAGVAPIASNAEIVRVTAIATDTFTIVRSQESSSARSIVVGDQIADAITVKTFTDIEALFPTGNVVGDTDSQTVSSKVLSDEFMGDVFDNQSAMSRSVTLSTGKDFIAIGTLEVGATTTLELPATSTLEIVNYEEQSNSSASARVPTGCIQMYGGSTAPAGWLFCDGSAVSRTTYKALFNIIGTTFGVGDSSTTFNLPDMRQRFPMGLATSGTGNVLGGTGGTIDHVHGASSQTSGGASVNHTHAGVTTGAGSSAGVSQDHTHSSNDRTGTANPPFQVVNFMIKT